MNKLPLNPVWQAGYRGGLQLDRNISSIPGGVQYKSEMYLAGYRKGMKDRYIQVHNNWTKLGIAS